MNSDAMLSEPDGVPRTNIMVQSEQIRVREHGQVTIPARVRHRLGLKTGDILNVVDTPQGILIVSPEALASTPDRRDEPVGDLSATAIDEPIVRKELPRIADIVGIAPDFTGDQTTDDWLEERRQRDDEPAASVF